MRVNERSMAPRRVAEDPVEKKTEGFSSRRYSKRTHGLSNRRLSRAPGGKSRTGSAVVTGQGGKSGNSAKDVAKAQPTS